MSLFDWEMFVHVGKLRTGGIHVHRPGLKRNQNCKNCFSDFMLAVHEKFSHLCQYIYEVGSYILSFFSLTCIWMVILEQ